MSQIETSWVTHIVFPLSVASCAGQLSLLTLLVSLLESILVNDNWLELQACQLFLLPSVDHHLTSVVLLHLCHCFLKVPSLLLGCFIRTVVYRLDIKSLKLYF